jgi:hypothetical protein
MSDKKAWEDRIDGALEAWPTVKAADEPALAEKTMNRIRANFPPKSKLTLTDDALVTSPFPEAADDQTSDVSRDSSDDWQDVSREATIGEDEQTPQSQPAMTAAAAPIDGPDATLETALHPLADVTQEIRPDKNQQLREKSSQIDVPISRSSSIPPPSSGVARSSGKQHVAAPSEPKQKKVEERMGQVERQRDRASFKELAKLAATPPPASVKPSSAKVPVATPSSSSALKGDSGVVDLQAAALSDPHAAERAKSTPLASGSLFDEEGPSSGRASVSPPSMSGEHPSSGPISAAHSVPQQIDPYSPASVRPSAPPSAGRISAMPMSAGPHSAVAAMQQPAKKEGKSGVGVILVSLVGVAAIAAGGFLYVHKHHATAVAAADTSSLAPVAASQPVATTQPVAVAQNDQPAVADTTVSAGDPAVAQNTIPGAKSAAKPVAHSAKTGKPSIVKDSTAKTEVDTPTAPPVVADTKSAAGTKDEAPPPVGGSANLQNAMQTAAGPSDSTSTQAAATGPKFAPGSVPQRPSQGALASAIGRVLPDARSCLGPDDGVSYANIVFESGGSVQNVTLSGFAANKPAGACITTALKKGQVGPFAEPTYSAKVTVRP